MELFRLIILQILLLAIVLTAVTGKNQETSVDTNTFDQNDSDYLAHDVKHQKKKHKLKAKRSANRRNWSPKMASYSGYMPPYLVFNRKAGAYYPYYSYPETNNYVANRRNMHWKKHHQT